MVAAVEPVYFVSRAADYERLKELLVDGQLQVDIAVSATKCLSDALPARDGTGPRLSQHRTGPRLSGHNAQVCRLNLKLSLLIFLNFIHLFVCLAIGRPIQIFSFVLIN